MTSVLKVYFNAVFANILYNEIIFWFAKALALSKENFNYGK